MIPDLGKYAEAVLSAYAAALLLLAGLVILTLWQGARMKRALEEVEGREAARREGE